MAMIDMPYVKQPDPKSCALACYTMVAKYFFPEITFEQIAEISNWQKGYVVWAFKFWLWIMDKGVHVNEYDTLDYEAWAKNGLIGLKNSVPEKEFEYYLENSKDLETYTSDINKVLKHQNFTLVKEKPTFELLENAVKNDGVCEVVLDSRTLRDREGFSLHRVVVLGISDDEVIFHDPAYAPNTKVSKEKFMSSWLEAVPEPELCIYKTGNGKTN
ncbi:MAG: cysteine peptidase family C39 domain-containing protein [Candidatus Curtissbacteria bacterium]|nr:cysteine peptidase family C39 domain-containing protein [Candidatus Curtissbacteria bacterium]